jgi:hypothetical protein
VKQSALVFVVAATCATLLAACGSSKPAAHKAAGFSKQYAASRCMRAHGIQNFPDPRSDGGNTVSSSPGSSTITIAGIAFSGPAFEKAEKLCDPLGLGTGPPPISEATKRRLIGFAECMRHHGLTQWADPTFPPGGGIEQGGGPYSRTDPKVQAAAKACNAHS